MGDIAHMIPVMHPYLASAQGKTHGADFRITEPEHAYLTPAKLLAMTAIALPWADAPRPAISSPSSTPPSPDPTPARGRDGAPGVKIGDQISPKRAREPEPSVPFSKQQR